MWSQLIRELRILRHLELLVHVCLLGSLRLIWELRILRHLELLVHVGSGVQLVILKHWKEL